MGSKIFICPNRGHLPLEIDVFRFFRPEKQKFRCKIPLKSDFGRFWEILRKSIFWGPWAQKPTKNVKKLKFLKKTPSLLEVICPTKMSIFRFFEVGKNYFGSWYVPMYCYYHFILVSTLELNLSTIFRAVLFICYIYLTFDGAKN